MGVVFRAWDRAADRPVALKAVLEDKLSPQRLERFRREGEVTASLQHPGILRIHAAGEFRGRPYIAYELVEGVVDFDAASRDASRDQVVAWVRDAALALGAAHAKGVVHRDVKPDNLLIDAGGHLKVADFGLALASDMDKLTRTGAVLGTPQFMAPELFAGKGKAEVGPECDVWALGVLLYRALSGSFPFEAPSIYELGARVVGGKFTPLRKLDRSISPLLQAVCHKAMEVDVRQRYSDGSLMAADLDRAQRGETVTASGMWFFPTRARRHLPFVGVGVALTAVMFAAATWNPAQDVQRHRQALASATPSAQPSATSPPESSGELAQATPTPTKSPPTFEDVVEYIGKNLVRADTTEAGVVSFQTGEMFRNAEDFTAARKWYRKAAGEGFVRAMRKLGEAYHFGKLGVDVDYRQAAEYYRQAARAGDWELGRKLGRWLMIGKKGLPKDRRDAYRVLLPCAEAGDLRSAISLAQLLREGGDGVPHDPNKADEWEAFVERNRDKGKSKGREGKGREGKSKDGKTQASGDGSSR
jgi:hypothetical protein